MKKFLVLLCMLMIGTSAFSEIVFVETNTNMTNYWEKNGRVEQKIYNIGYQIINDNNLKRAAITIDKTPKIINAFSQNYSKNIFISTGILPYIENDDEMAYILAHEISHSMEAYGGFLKITAMSMNSKKYESKADLNAIDYMVKSGYNPVASIIVANKIFGEPLWDWGFLSTHPKGTKRMLNMYKYMYVKYPQYLKSSMTQNVLYQNFLNSQNYEIKKFVQEQKNRNARLNKEDI